MTFDNTFSTPISVLKFMYDKEKEINDLLTKSPFNSKGMWVRGSEYQLTDLVQDGNALYICVKEIQNSITKPSEDTEHFSLWFSVSTSTGSAIKSVTYDNTTLDAHLTEIQNHLNSENGGTLVSVVIKISSIFNVDYFDAYIGATETSAFKETGTWGDETFVLYPQSRTGEHAWQLSNDKYVLPLDNTLIMQMFTGKDFGNNTTRIDFSTAKINLSGKTIEHLTINYME